MGLQVESNGSDVAQQGRGHSIDWFAAEKKIKKSMVSHQDFRQDFTAAKNFL
jgi:hypothetical protein